ncbi:hypothetical protein WA556_006608, partial [Blastocystis sp. ATCC 50177/Nand II]
MDDIFSHTFNNVLVSDPDTARIKFFTRVRTSRLLRSKDYTFTENERTIISECKKKRFMHVATIGGATAAVSILGLAFSARKKLILEYAALVGGVLMYQEFTEDYGTCLFGLCQLPQSDLASEIRSKVFQEVPRSRSADFLRALGYDEKHIETPVVKPIQPLENAKKVDLQPSVAAADLRFMQLLNRMRRFFPTSAPSFAKLDNIERITFVSADHATLGASFHLEGSAEEVVAMIRRVSLALRASTAPEYAGLRPLVATVYRHGDVLSAEVVATRAEEAGLSLGSFSLPRPAREARSVEVAQHTPSVETHEEPAHRVPRVEAEPSEYAMKEDAGYHGTSIAPADEKRGERGYHGTSIAPADEKRGERGYHGTSI